MMPAKEELFRSQLTIFGLFEACRVTFVLLHYELCYCGVFVQSKPSSAKYYKELYAIGSSIILHWKMFTDNLLAAGADLWGPRSPGPLAPGFDAPKFVDLV